jgi:hypothetical protein
MARSKNLGYVGEAAAGHHASPLTIFGPGDELIGKWQPQGGVDTPGRFVRERDQAIASMLDERPMAGHTLEVEVREREDHTGHARPDITILWEREVPLAARLGVSVLVRLGADSQSRAAIEEAARAEGLSLQTLGERRLWTLLGVPS